MGDPQEASDMHWQTVVQMVRSGGYDDNLDALERMERERHSTRTSVLNAIEERRSE